MWNERNFKVTINLYKRLCLPVITWNKKHISKQVPVTYTLENKFFAVATFEGL